MSTFSDILTALRIQEPISVQYDLSDSHNPDLDELRFRLAQTSIKVHAEWTNFELYKMLKSGTYNLDSMVPCKHCTK